MPPPSKRVKVNAKAEEVEKVDNELETFKNEIRKIKGLGDSTGNETPNTITYQHDYRLVDQQTNKSQLDLAAKEDIKKYIREQITAAEKRIYQRFDRMEQKLDNLIERLTPQQIEEQEVLEDWPDQEGNAQKSHVAEVDSQIFPILDEETFDWFFEQLRDDECRDAFINSRWQLSRTVSTKTVNVSVKEFLRKHFELSLCVKYSISGFGAHGVKKRKLDSLSLSNFVYECFNIAFPQRYTYKEINKAIVQFWGRAPDSLNKLREREIKRETISY